MNRGALNGYIICVWASALFASLLAAPTTSADSVQDVAHAGFQKAIELLETASTNLAPVDRPSGWAPGAGNWFKLSEVRHGLEQPKQEILAASSLGRTGERIRDSHRRSNVSFVQNRWGMRQLFLCGLMVGVLPLSICFGVPQSRP